MNNILRAVLVTGFLFVLFTPDASALTFQPYRAFAPSDPCGGIDPASPCWYPLGSNTDCPTAKDYSSCLSRCTCQYEKNLKKCNEEGGGAACRELAGAENRACGGHCLVDYAALIVSDDILAA